MPDLTTTHLKCLLEKAASGPWEYTPGEAIDERCIGNPGSMTMCIAVEANGAGSSCSDADLNLAAAAPQLAQEVIRLRDALGYLMEETRLAAENSEDVVVQKRVVNAIETTIIKVLGKHDD
ncbi:hypothetical protein RAE03_10530 [Corynebacterium tuberculostearicum]|uniref:Uncharacterized protein n=1 Tax=Corynebacterium tuberculostearicum TaxID=38304 RepID=A0AAE4NN32_9CORY|nr:hypothetical protein [Corynebacterium tuberculostearicum]MDV2420198.1 hypothetical protein [Corynebacterium tuberculostearicum]